MNQISGGHLSLLVPQAINRRAALRSVNHQISTPLHPRNTMRQCRKKATFRRNLRHMANLRIPAIRM
jgi:hypothetical protein